MGGNEEKTCFKCGASKPRSDFYRHPKMADGLLGKCKSCTKRDVSLNYKVNRPQYQEYERGRVNLPHRRAFAAKSRARNPQKYKARTAVANAVRDGRLAPQPCEVCGSAKVQGHHEDYFKPLEVRWLCFEHHMAHHGRVANGNGGARVFDVNRKKAA